MEPATYEGLPDDVDVGELNLEGSNKDFTIQILKRQLDEAKVKVKELEEKVKKQRINSAPIQTNTMDNYFQHRDQPDIDGFRPVSSVT